MSLTATTATTMRTQAVQPVLSFEETFEEPPGLSMDEVCAALSISSATARNWIRLGKIAPDLEYSRFSPRYVETLLSSIRSGKDGKLTGRRNKSAVTGNAVYKDYVRTERNVRCIESLLSSGGITGTDDLRLVLANFGVQLYYQSRSIAYGHNNVLVGFLRDGVHDDFHGLIGDLLRNVRTDDDAFDRLGAELEHGVVFVPGEDTLGFAYMSLRDVGERKRIGAYYTPERIVGELLDGLTGRTLVGGAFDDATGGVPDEATICDPCCGSGNFLIGLMMRGVHQTRLYGQDVDPISVQLARINVALLDSTATARELRERLTVGDTLTEPSDRRFDVVVGNPPWGSAFTATEASLHRARYRTAEACKGKLESSDLFVERALDMLNEHGTLSFVLPESALGVASHRRMRQLLMERCSLRFVSYLGNVFSGVQAPSVILQAYAGDPGSVSGCVVHSKDRTFVIGRERRDDDCSLPLNMTDDEYECLHVILAVPDAAYLKGNATFALGIVTGDNKRFVADERHDGYEPVLKGSDVMRYGIKSAGHYLRFRPDMFQQVAPVSAYRAPEKLLYRFIGDMPTFAYDDRRTLSLNSCNVLIPRIPGLSVKYVLAVLNSRVTAYALMQRYHSVKLLKSHIESMPIPVVAQDVQRDVARRVDDVMAADEQVAERYDELDEVIMRLYGLDHDQRQVVRRALQGRKLLLRQPSRA